MSRPLSTDYAAASKQERSAYSASVLAPAWRLPAVIAALGLLAILLLPSASPVPLFGGVLFAWAVALGLFFVLKRREDRLAQHARSAG